MKLKLTDEQLQGLFNYFEQHVISFIPQNDLAAIAQELLCDIFLKIDRRLKTRYRKNSNITLNSKECAAFRWYFDTYGAKEGWLYETTLVRRLILTIQPAKLEKR